ncbi:unnamed protein product [Diatraea saccharalis]|uniref:C2H2-type domain-containing protein n=1 Tax=Diatraea saccharalis TaxID=40085 RepID=A0A9N9R045_9NEOP|nr:unnamed protein product [Diatraea saccharalis]
MTSTQEFSCVFCKDSFENKEELQIHFRKHGDPKFNQSLRIKNRSQNEASDEKRNEDEELVNCDVCPEVFPTISKAITHKHKVHPDHDAKYFCPWCGKLFTMKHLYNKHLQSTHQEQGKNDDVNFHCDMCNVDFFIATAMLYHNKFFHRQDTDLSSVGQSKKLRMINQDILQIYYCAFCGDEYDNKVNLHKHVLDDHNDENQCPEDVLRCPLCEAIFYHLDAYELHLTFHSTEDLYTETNELFEQITEFSLETVPPLMEKVEIVESQDAETAMNAIGLEKFLEMAMDNSNDNDSEKPKKSKKHKKHKKSKKPAITLDEFLNMNKDVFGEGLDFEGIEEVPTKVIAKRLKQKKVGRPSLKRLESTNIEKLKKQGIIVKMNSKKLPIKAVKLGNKLPSKQSEVQQNTQNKATLQTKTPNEVLSKLSNSEIKIIKTSSNEKTDFDSHSELTSTSVEGIKKCQSPENNKESHIKHSLVASSGAKEKTEDQAKKFYISNAISRTEPQTDFECSKNTNSGLIKNSTCFETKPVIEKDCINKENNDNIEKKYAQIKPNILSNNISVKSSIPANCSEINKESDTINSTEVQFKLSDKSLKSDHSDTGNTKQLLASNDNKKNSLDALKHLSHLITVKSVNSKGSPTSAQRLQNNSDTNDSDEEDTGNISDHNEDDMPDNETKVTFDSLQALKTLNKNITVKPLMHSKNVIEKKYDNVAESKDDNVAKSNKTQVLERYTPAKNLAAVNIDNNVKLPKQTAELKQISNIDTYISEKLEKQNANVNLLKHLRNITAKPVNKTSKTTTTDKSSGSSQLLGKKGITQTEVNKKEINENIEIYNIDDSDSDEAAKSNSIRQEVNTTKIISNEYTSNKSLEKLKHVQNITVKSLNQQTTKIKKNVIKQIPLSKQALHNSNQCSMSDFSDEDDQDMFMPANLSINQKLSLQSSNIQALKNLGKNITVKSRNSSPSVSVTSNKDLNFESRDDMDDPDSDNDFVPGKVKITELKDDNMSDNEINDRESNTHGHDVNVFVQSPEGSNSDNDNVNDFNEDPGDEMSDLETHIKTNTLRKPFENTQVRSLDIKNINKNLTIKSINKGNKEIQPSPSKVIPSAISSNKELSIKPFKQTTEEENDSVSGINSKVTKSAQAINQLVNQNVASDNQVSTVNKEVTVKTFQTKTVIQEITTTVTKTIKTVNQTVKQQSQSSRDIAQPIKYQKVQGMRSNQNFKNFQGVTVRQATPTFGTKVRGLTPTRPTIGATLRPPNQLVPVRPSFNPTRATTPRMPTVKKIGPSSSPRQQGPSVGRPIKISPNVMTTTKRPSEDAIGHFSCFKKPKESLIPVSDVPNFDNEQMNSTVQYTSHSKTNFSSATKVVRGNTVVTASQVKTEMSSSSQLSKLNNLSGIKVVKTSQSKQAVQVEEKNELNASQRNTLEAIEKLQKQGLLIKKPRVEVNNDSDPSDGENDQYLTEEPED